MHSAGASGAAWGECDGVAGYWPAVAVCWIWSSTDLGSPVIAVPICFWIAVSTVLQLACELGYSVAVLRFFTKPANCALDDMLVVADVVAGSRSYSLSKASWFW